MRVATALVVAAAGLAGTIESASAAELRASARRLPAHVLAALDRANQAAAVAAEATIAGVPDMVGPTQYAEAASGSTGPGGTETGRSGTTGSEDTETGATGATGVATGATGVDRAGATGATGAGMGATGGSATTSNCASGLATAERLFKENGVTPEELPRHINKWCYELFSRRPHISISSHVVHKVCDQSMQIFERRALSSRYSESYARSDEFCIHLKHTFDTLLSHPESVTGPDGKMRAVTDRGMPSQAEIQKLPGVTSVNRSGKTRYCCGPHQEPGCFDRSVQDCVCKADPFCCDGEWDKSCAQNVEAFLCAQCEA